MATYAPLSSCRSNLQAPAGSVQVVPGWLWLHRRQPSTSSVSGVLLAQAACHYPRQSVTAGKHITSACHPRNPVRRAPADIPSANPVPAIHLSRAAVLTPLGERLVQCSACPVLRTSAGTNLGTFPTGPQGSPRSLRGGFLWRPFWLPTPCGGTMADAKAPGGSEASLLPEQT